MSDTKASLANKKILISGASAAGPTLAYWLRRYGFEPVVVERHPSIRPGGYAIDVRGAAIQIADKMGILPAIREADTHLEQVYFFSESGELQASMDPNFGAGEGIAGDVELLRDDLAQILYRATKDDVRYLFSNSISKITDDGAGVNVEFENGDAERFDLVIGADGSHSNVRNLVFGDESQFAHFSNRYICVFTIPNYLNLDSKWYWHLRPGFMGGLQQYGESQQTRGIFIYSGDLIRFDSRNVEEQKSLVRKAMADHMVWEIPRLVEEMSKATDFYFDSISQIKMPNWSKGRVSLVGDAAAGPTPLTGQGTSTAMVGAYILAGELAEARGDYEVAFKRYDEINRPFAELNQDIIFRAREMQIPTNWDEVNQQIEFLHAMKDGDGEAPEGSVVDVVQTAANAITLKDYSHLYV